MPAADCSNSEECSKSCRHMSQCTSNVSAHASIQICNRKFLDKRKTKAGDNLFFASERTSIFAMSFVQEVKDIPRQIRNLSKKQRRAAAVCVANATRHTPRILPVYVLARHSSSVAVDLMSGCRWRHCQIGKSFDSPSLTGPRVDRRS